MKHKNGCRRITYGYIVALILALLWPSSNALADDYSSYINNGRGLDLKERLATKVSLASEVEKAEAVGNLLELCFLIQDTRCFTSTWDKHFQKLYDQLEVLRKEDSPEAKLVADAYFDKLRALYMHRAILSSSGQLIKERVEALKELPPASPRHGLAGLLQAVHARGSAMVEDKYSARRFQRAARTLIFARNINLIAYQSLLGYFFETSLYTLHDVEDIKRLYGALVVAEKASEGVSNANFINPYTLLRLLHVIYDANVLRPEQELVVLRRLHHLYQTVQIAAESELANRREGFYAYLALEKVWGFRTDLDFDPVQILFQGELTSFAGLGVQAYLTAAGHGSSPVGHSISLGRALSWFEANLPKLDPSISRLQEPTYRVLKSLQARLDGDPGLEGKSLELFVRSQLKFFRRSGYSQLDPPPSLSRPALLVNSYAIDRLKELQWDKEVIAEFALLNIILIDSLVDTRVKMTYAMLASKLGALKRDHVESFIAVERKYSAKVSEIYAKTFVEMRKRRDPTVINGIDGVSALIGFETFMWQNETFLRELASQPNQYAAVSLADLRALLAGDVGVLHAEGPGFDLVLTIDGPDANVNLMRSASDKEFQQAKSLLLNRVVTSTKTEVEQASRVFSSTLFGGRVPSGERIIFLTGPTLSGVPYTLLTNLKIGKWLIQVAEPRAFASIEHFRFGRGHKPESRPISLVAFANPYFASREALAANLRTKSIIRGAQNISSLPPLPETESEAKALTELAGPDSSTVYSRESANADSLFSTDFNAVEIASFSTHGVMAGEVAGVISPSMVLSPTAQDSGVVSSELLFSLRGAPLLAILAMCNSGTTDTALATSEIRSIQDVFLLKGSRAVISSFWPVNSAATVKLVELISADRSANIEFGRALAGAARALIDNPRWSHPSNWAAFTFTGEYASNRERDSARQSIGGPISGIVTSAVSNGKGALVAYMQKNVPTAKFARITLDEGQIELSDFAVRGNEYSAVYMGLRPDGKIFAAGRRGDRVAYGEISKSGDYIKKCEANVDASWDLIKIVPIANYLNVLYTKQNNEKSVSVAVSSIDMNSCEGRIFGPATIDEFWGAYHRKLFSIFPVGDSGELLLTHVHPAEPDDDARYNGGTTLVGTVEECLIQNRTNLYHLNKDLSLNKVHLWSDLRVLGTHQGQLMAVSYDPCTITDRASVIAPEWLISGDKPVWYYDGGKAQANAERALPELNRQFSKIVDWRRLNDHEFEYVEGASALTEYLFSADRDSRLSPKTVRFLRDSQYGLHVRKRGDTLWKKMVDESECPIIEPLIFSGVPVALCVDAKEQSFRVIRMQP